MGFSCGIVGLPNVGKSTLFNALMARAAAAAANYPFCTIEPNEGRVPVPDERLERLAHIYHSAKIIPTQLTCTDIAGLVRGAHQGEGLGNQFLGHIRQVQAIIHVLRCFQDPNITHVEGAIDPLRDKEVVELELLLADCASLQRRLAGLEKKLKQADSVTVEHAQVLQQLLEHLQQGHSARTFPFEAKHIPFKETLDLLTLKPVMYACNVAEEEAKQGNEWVERVKQAAGEAPVVMVSAALEEQLAQIAPEEQKGFLELWGLESSGLKHLIRRGYDLLGLMTFFTCGPKETHAWTVLQGAKAPQAAGVIHSDFERGFIRAEVMAYDDLITYGSEAATKAAGKWRVEGSDYSVQEGDILHFRCAP